MRQPGGPWKVPAILQAEAAEPGAAIPAEIRDFAASCGLAAELEGTCLCSLFIRQWLQHPQSDWRRLLSTLTRPQALQLTEELHAGHMEVDAFDAALRRFRNHELVRIAWRDISGRAQLAETLAQTSMLADLCIEAAVDFHHLALAAVEGIPSNAEGTPQSLMVYALGKLGGGELNFSSDVDLIFAYVDPGMTHGGRAAVDNQEYFTRLARRVIRSLDSITGQGLVFRVDTRLRPFGDSGPLVMSLAAAQHYYLNHARDWERYAMIKARLVVGPATGAVRFEEVLKPFVYRRYLDFGAIQSLRTMKAGITAEVERKGLRDDVKRGPGGIREIEFIVQCLQLIRGGRSKALQTRSFKAALQAAESLGLIGPAEAQGLSQAYDFLRHTEHRLQQVHDRQTQRLPRDEVNRARLAFSLGFADWDAFQAALSVHRKFVAREFSRLLAGPTESSGVSDTDVLQSLWNTGSEEGMAQLLAQCGHEVTPVLQIALKHLHVLASSSRIGPETRQRVSQLIPLIATRTARERRPTETLQRALNLIVTILGRSGYLALLIEHPSALTELVRLCAASPWVANQIAQQPLLLDDLLDPSRLYAPPGASALADDLAARMELPSAGDVEAQMNVLREFRHSQVLRIAAADLMGTLPLAEVSNHLTAVASCVVLQALALATQDIRRRHGNPAGVEAAEQCLPFAVVGYGKLGGMELSYRSDLDLVFLFDAPDGNSDGPSPLDTASYFNRLGQRLIHYLATLTPAGRAYEVDARLRPNGSSGLLVSRIMGFERYQMEQAWPWEHQALVRARAIAGAVALCQDFAGVRHRVLSRPRDTPALRDAVVDMRRRMLRERDSGDSSHFDIKSGAGGMTDIEFMVQYAVLQNAAAHPGITAYTDNLRLLGLLARHGLMSDADARALRDAYFSYRGEIHRSALLETPTLVQPGLMAGERAAVGQAWLNMFGEPLV